MPRHRAGDEQQVGVARAGDELDAQAFDVVVGVVERVDLQLAAVARAGVDLPDRQRLAEDREQLGMDLLRGDTQRLAALGRRLGANARVRDLPGDLPHQRSCPE